MAKKTEETIAPLLIPASAAAVEASHVNAEGADYSSVYADDIDFSDFALETLSFPAYWMPKFHCKVCKKELGKSEFFCAKHPPVENDKGVRESNIQGNQCFGTLLGLDVQTLKTIDPLTGELKIMKRWVMIAGAKHKCWKGPTDAQTPVDVKPGDDFSLVAYGMLRLEAYTGYRLLIKAIEKRKDPADAERSIIIFDVGIDHRAKQMRSDKRLAAAKAASANILEMRANGTTVTNSYASAKDRVAPPASVYRMGKPVTSENGLASAAAKLTEEPEHF